MCIETVSPQRGARRRWIAAALSLLVIAPMSSWWMVCLRAERAAHPNPPPTIGAGEP